MTIMPAQRARLTLRRPAAPGIAIARHRFSGFTEGQLKEIFNGLEAEKYPAGAILFSPDDPAERLFLLRKGCVDLYRLTPSGKRLVTRRLGQGSVFGVMGLLGQKMQGSFAETIEDSLICTSTRVQVVELLKRRSEVALRLLELVGGRLSQVEERLVELAYSPVRVRLAHFLLTNMDPTTGKIDGLSHAEIGDTIGALRQTVTETLAELKRRGFVATGLKYILVRDRKALGRLAGE